MVKVKELKTSQTFIPRTISNLFRNIQYPHKKLIRGMPQCVHLICKCLRKKTTLKYITEDPIVWISKHDKVWGMPQCAHPLGRWICTNLIPSHLSKASCCMKKPSWMWGLTQTLMPSVTWWNGRPTSHCKNWCHHARIGVCPSMNITNQQAEGVLDILDPLHPLSLIVDQRWRDETKNNMRSQYPSRNGALEASRTPISRLSLSEWNASKQTWDLIASGSSYDLDHNEA